MEIRNLLYIQFAVSVGLMVAVLEYIAGVGILAYFAALSLILLFDSLEG